MGPRLLHYSDIESAHDDPDRIGRLAGTLHSLNGPDALLVGSGDNTAPGVLSMVTEGRQSLDFFAAVEPDFETFGNHDFDHGLSATRHVVERSPQTWLTANVRKNGDRFLADETESWALREVAGTAVGFVGVTNTATGSANPSADPLTFTDPFAAVADATAALRARGAELVVVVSHLGRTDDELARRCDVDVILGGHVHERRIDYIDGTLLTRPGSNGHVVVDVDLGGARPTAQFRTVEDGDRMETVTSAVEGRLAETGLNDVVAHVEEPISREKTDAYGGESRIGNVVADAYRWATGADVGLQNGGGIRRDESPLAGDVTVADLVSVVPFEEPVVVAEVTGAELRAICREASGRVVEHGDSDWWHAHVSGLELVWDRETQSVERLRVGGDPVADGETYTLATSEYLLHTTVEFPTLTESHRVAAYDLQYEVLAEYARSDGIDAAVTGRVVRR
ncbi:bifunctional metallophosphatase/5'-nucleotidase [Haloarcula amylovorans]|uniref:bifunctional metallophosphatase/5'-nucleotidase n=1 Tax=Haloarcula amylovorans TaxID=2562280 RepID=UPI0010769FA6|nr:bifunctional metallophosphatase/5'-nucleotidase [Halomicroarcula amylolytica]